MEEIFLALNHKGVSVLSCSLRPTTRLRVIQSLKLLGGITSSIFPEVEAALLGNLDYQRAIEFMIPNKTMGWYRSTMDLLFCELHPKYRASCRTYYVNKGPMLKDLITVDEWVEYNSRLLKALEVAHDLFCEQRQMWWGWYRRRVERAFRATA